MSLYAGAFVPVADNVNRARDQLVVCACLSLAKNVGIRRRGAFYFFEPRFRSRTVTYNLLESALMTVVVTGLESFVRSHISSQKDLLVHPDGSFRYRISLFRAARTLSIRVRCRTVLATFIFRELELQPFREVSLPFHASPCC